MIRLTFMIMPNYVQDIFHRIKDYQSVRSCRSLTCTFHGSNKECRSIVRDESSVYFNVTAKHV